VAFLLHTTLTSFKNLARQSGIKRKRRQCGIDWKRKRSMVTKNKNKIKEGTKVVL